MRNQSIYDDMTTAERMVAEYINQLGFWWNFEQPVFVFDDKERPRVWSPDLYIPALGIYVEVIGNPNLSNYDYRWEVYQKNSIPIIFIDVNFKDWHQVLKDTVVSIHQERWERIKNLSYRTGSL